jgi:class 3 adenylate cyclase/tetratricopeptide (TPR) repeat protein
MEQRPMWSSADVEERRLLTIMFGDMIGSTSLSETIGADSMHELLKLYQRTCTRAVVDNEGILSSWMGDGFMAHFGYPLEHEDAAVRAVEAGLAVLSSVEALGPGLMDRFGVEIEMRIGIHTGLVVVSEAPEHADDRNPVFFIGETPNIASRIEAGAAANSISISEATWELVRGYFDVEALGPQQLRGFRRRINTFRVRGRTGATSRYFARSDQQTPLVGREVELLELLDFADRVPAGPTGFLGLVGEPGLGKTRLLDELVRAVGATRDVLYSACAPRANASPLYPFVQLVRELAGCTVGDPGAFAAFAARFAPFVPDETSLARLAALAGVEPPNEALQQAVTPERALRDTADAVYTWLCRRSDHAATILLVDDAQWLDPTSRDVLAKLASGPAGLGVVLAYRPEPGTEWITSMCADSLELQPLNRAQSVQLIGHVAEVDELRLVEAAARSDGVPLFAEELARTLASGELQELGSIPNTLHDLMVSRLDRIPDSKVLAQVGASIGREFEADLLAATTGLPLATILDRADVLLSARIWERGQLHGRPAFSFRHALIQDVSYDSQIRERKHHVHARVADVLTERGAATAGDLATVAHHLEHAGPERLPASVSAWTASGFATANGGAHVEAVSHFRRGLELLRLIDDPAVAAPLELPLQLGLGASLSTTAGYGFQPVRATFARARELCGVLGSPPELYPAVWGLWAFHLVRGDYAIAEELARSCANIAKAAADPALDIESAAALGITSFYRGNLQDAIRQLTSTVDRYTATRAITPFQRFQHPAVAALSHLALAHWLVGDAPQAHRAAVDATDLADTCEEHLRWYAREYAQTFRAALGSYMADAPSCREHAQRAIEVCNQHGSQMFLAGAQVYHGYAQVGLGAVDEGTSRLETACENYLRTGATLFRPYHLVLLGRARSARGDDRGALDALDAAADLAEHTGELVHLPVILAERGRRVLAAAPADEARARSDVERSLELADRLGIDRSTLDFQHVPSVLAGSTGGAHERGQ